MVLSQVALDRRGAAAALTQGEPPEPGAVIGALTTHVEALARLNAVLASTQSIKEMSRRTALQRGLHRLVRQAVGGNSWTISAEGVRLWHFKTETRENSIARSSTRG